MNNTLGETTTQPYARIPEHKNGGLAHPLQAVTFAAAEVAKLHLKDYLREVISTDEARTFAAKLLPILLLPLFVLMSAYGLLYQGLYLMIARSQPTWDIGVTASTTHASLLLVSFICLMILNRRKKPPTTTTD